MGSTYVCDQKLGYLRSEARKVNPSFQLLTNGFHAVNADFCMSERKALELNYHRIDVGYCPGRYDPRIP
jgi:hypothetical protein